MIYDFLFISDPTTMASSHMPYYFLYLAGYLRERGYAVKIADYKDRAGYGRRADYYWDVWLPRELNENPAHFTCLSCYTPHFESTIKLGDMVKAIQPRTTLVVGNAHATVRPQDFLYGNSPFDYVVRGEGERPLLELARRGDGKHPVPGTVWLNATGGLETAPQAELLSGGDIAIPAYSLIDVEWYLRPQRDLIRPLYTRSAYVFTSRGCVHDCDFCATNVIWKANKGKRVRQRPLSRVLMEITQLKERWGAEFVYIADDTFGWNGEWLRDWFQWYSVEKYLPYAVQTRVDQVTEGIVIRLKETGCIQLDVGMESGSQALLDNVNKGITVEQVERVAAWCRKHRLRLYVFLMVNLPGETEDDLKATESLMGRIRTAGCTVSICMPYPGTLLNDRYMGVESGNDYGWYVEDRARVRMAAHALDLKELEQRWNREFRAAPMFMRMWPASSPYWKVLWNSRHKRRYIGAWARDLPLTFAKWWVGRLGLASRVKALMGK